jgi:hypothetical protein
MRTLMVLGTAAILAFGAVGCGGGNQAKAEALTQQMIDEMSRVAEGFEKGDKAAIKASLTKIVEIGRSGKDIKLTASQKTALETKFKPQMETIQKKLMEAMPKAMASGKLTPADLLEIGNEMKNLETALKGIGNT